MERVGQDGVVAGEFETILDLFDEVVRVAGAVEAFIEFPEPGVRRSITFEGWAARADALASWLIEQGVRHRDVVAIHLPSGMDYAIAYQAIIRAGAVASGVNTRLGPAERDQIFAIAEPVHCFDSVLPDLGDGDPVARRAAVAGQDPVAIVWTGGTTGVPKGAWFDHHCLRAMSLGGAPLCQPRDRRLSPLPFAHVGYMTRVWEELMNVVTTVVSPTPWAAETTLSVLESEAVTVCQGVPTQYEMMLDHPSLDTTDLSSLRIAATGAARVPPEMVAAVRERFGCPVVVRYASTESSLVTGTRLDDEVDVISTTVGRPNGDVELRLMDDHGVLIEPGTQQVGRIQIRSRASMRGYWKDPEKTSEVFTSDGWLDTGDLGWVGDDGNLRLTGRRAEMYIRGGYNVYPIEIENCLGSHPGVKTVAVVGARVDHRLGEVGVMFAVPQAGAELDLMEIRDFVRSRLADYKAPDALVVVDALPLTALGKVDKKALQNRADLEAITWKR